MQLISTNLTVQRSGNTVFSGLDFYLPAGQLLTVTGPNGVGKSTLLRIIASMAVPACGSVYLHENGKIHLPALSCHYLGNKNAMKPTLTVAENLRFWASCLGTRQQSAPQHALAAVHLAHTAQLPFSTLSTGQQRRVAIARLLLVNQPLWLLDEPTAGLDDDAVALLAVLMQHHLKAGGLIIAATHLPLGIAAATTINLSEYAA